MSTISTIIKNLILPIVIKSAKFDVSSAPDVFWEQFAIDFVTYETDASTIYSTLYKLELNNPEYIFNQLPGVFSNFIKEIAEEYVLGNESEITDKLIESKNASFLKEVSFLTDLKAVITKSERNQLKNDLPQAYDRLIFELDEETLQQVAKKKIREDLKDKFKQWEEELVEEESEEYSFAKEPISLYKNQESEYNSNTQSNVFSLSWIKYAAAACIVLTAGIMYFKFNTENITVQPGDTNVVTAPVKKDTTSKGTITPEIPSEALAEVATVTKNATVIESSFGFASKEKKINIIENNQGARMQSIVIAIDKYRQLLENELNGKPISQRIRVIELENKINSLQKELALLKKRENQYEFDGKVLILYVSTTAIENEIVLYNKKYYLKKDSDYYLINSSKIYENLIKESNTDLIEILNELLVENQ